MDSTSDPDVDALSVSSLCNGHDTVMPCVEFSEVCIATIHSLNHLMKTVELTYS